MTHHTIWTTAVWTGTIDLGRVRICHDLIDVHATERDALRAIVECIASANGLAIPHGATEDDLAEWLEAIKGRDDIPQAWDLRQLTCPSVQPRGFRVMCRVSGGVTGTREDFLKKNGTIAEFETREAAAAEAARLTTQYNNAHAVACFEYWVVVR
ncbi:MAG TPA: hypothetical protein VKE96_00090 [Vicinamibacterales bacterium]|nr:hypothetical protein [Vicinamibacterales bacterium]